MQKPTLEQIKKMIIDPQSDPLDVGLVLDALTQDDIEKMGFESLTDLIKQGILGDIDEPDYSTVMRWVRAASVLDGADDPMASLDFSKLVELAKIASSEGLDEFLAQHPLDDLTDRSVRDIKTLVRQARGGSRASPGADEPHGVLERAIARHIELTLSDISPRRIRLMTDETHGDSYSLSIHGPGKFTGLSSALKAAAQVIDAIDEAKAAWRSTDGHSERRPSEALSLTEVLELPPGQLEARWTNGDSVEVANTGAVIARIPVRRLIPSQFRAVSPLGNRKLRNVFGLIDTISQGCLRAATGFPLSDMPCFRMDDHSATGCYVEYSPFLQGENDAISNWSIIHNGLRGHPSVEIRLPASGNASLEDHRRQKWRVDSESADGAMSISLGIVQRWAESNPGKVFMTICSNAFRPSDEMLAWASALRNLWVGHTVSAWLSPEELEIRFRALRRFLQWGIPSVAWIVTHDSWDNEAVLEMALDLVSPEQIIEAPYRYGTSRQDLPLLHVNPLGACSDHRVTRSQPAVSCEVVRTTDPATGHTIVRLVDADGNTASLGSHSTCQGCQLLCGMGVLEDRRCCLP